MPVIRISEAEKGLGEGTAEKIAIGEHEMRRSLANGVLRAFFWGNIALWIVIHIINGCRYIIYYLWTSNAQRSHH